MRKKNKKSLVLKKTLSVVLSSLIFSQTALVANSNGDNWFAVPYDNITGMTQEGDLLGGFGANFGGIEYRFSNAGVNWKPWVDFQGPKLSAGCNGFSLSGGFIDFSGLEDIGEQLSNASQALIYGILIAIVNSLPSIEHVFSKIKEVVNWLQSMLRNSCNMGKAIGNALVTADMGNGKSFKDTTSQMTEAITNAGSSIAGSWMKESPSDLEKKIRDGLNSQTASSAGTEKEDVAKQAEQNAGKAFVVGGTIGICSNSIFNQKLNYENTKGKFAEIVSVLIDGETREQEIYLILANLIGDDGTDENTREFLREGVSSLFPALIAKGTANGDEKASEQSKVLSTNLANGTKNNMFSPTYSFSTYIPPRWSGAKFVSQLINGTETGDIEVTLMNAIAGWAVGITGSYKLLQPTGWALENGKYKTKKVKWLGLKAESEEAIKCYLGITQCSDIVKRRLLDKSIIEKLNYVKNLTNEKGSINNTKLSMSELEKALGPSISQLALINAYYILKYYILNLKDKTIANSDKPTNEDIENYRKRTKQLNQLLDEVDTQILKDLGTANQINEFYDRIANEVRRLQSKRN